MVGTTAEGIEIVSQVIITLVMIAGLYALFTDSDGDHE